MTNDDVTGNKMDESISYTIVLTGHLGPEWSAYFDGMEITTGYLENGTATTTLCGNVKDQAELYGILSHIRDLGLSILLMRRQDTAGT